jgi:hypothetical protein
VTHAVILWRAGTLPGIILGIGLGSMAANGIDRLATGVVHDWLSIGTMSWNLADFGVLLFVVVYAVHALRALSPPATGQHELVRAVAGERAADDGIDPANREQGVGRTDPCREPVVQAGHHVHGGEGVRDRNGRRDHRSRTHGEE